jgi:hypothetical protein
MFAFLTILVILGSITCTMVEKTPIYEAPVIVKQGGLIGSSKKVALNSKQLVILN